MFTSFRRPVAALSMISVMSLTAGCTNQPYSSPEEQAQNACQAFGPKTLSGALIGTFGGAGTGAAIGAIASGGKGAAIGAGAGALAGLIGGLITGNQLDKRDCAQAQAALQQVRYMNVGQSASWSTPGTGSYGSYTPLTGDIQQTNGQICRKVRQDTTLQGHKPTSQEELTCRDVNGDYTRVQPLSAA
ncbi:hypothetical protein [Acetobacter malorum]|uniref:hypothetical protein n=1 Tax=Acetobacter malorum TaxID=178901 RepID=UPI00248E71CE|nr:hypothetical protein [Acetobacter malorum]